METQKGERVSDIEEVDEEPGEVIESAPPLKVGEERELGNSGVKKKLLKRGHGWETPELNDEVTGIFPYSVHARVYVLFLKKILVLLVNLFGLFI